MAQQMSQVAESLGVLQARGFPAIADGPILALLAEDSFLLRTNALPRPTAGSRARCGCSRLKCHPNHPGHAAKFSAESRLRKIVPPAPSSAHNDCAVNSHAFVGRWPTKSGTKWSRKRSCIETGDLNTMKKLSTILTAGTIALTLSTPVLAGSAGISRNYATAQPDAQTIADLEQASEAAQREAREGNKDNPAFAQKSYQIDQ